MTGKGEDSARGTTAIARGPFPVAKAGQRAVVERVAQEECLKGAAAESEGATDDPNQHGTQQP